MLLPMLSVAIGFAVLAVSADRFVFGAAALARGLGVSPLVIGLTIVGFGTSAPELLISLFAALDGKPELALGNAIGSNIANTALVLGLAALVFPLVVRSEVLRREYPLMLASMLLALAVLLDGQLTVFDGMLLCIGMLGILAWTVSVGMHQRRGGRFQTPDALDREFEERLEKPVPLSTALTWLFVGLGLLLISSKVLVWGASELARGFGISDLVIGLTVVAIGTSLPEIAASVAGSLRKEPDIAVGNVLGSNMFNILAVVGVAGMVHPSPVSGALLYRDFTFMLLLAAALLALTLSKGSISRAAGGVGVALYLGYLAVLVLVPA
jgi:cation:H+ antiporter